MIVFGEQEGHRIHASVKVTEGMRKDEFGGKKRIYEDGGSGTGAEFISFQIVDVVRGRGFYCNAMECLVTGVHCGLSSPAVGDTVIIWDGLLCTFQAPFEVLEGAQGYAIRMATPDEYFADGGLESERPCRWEVLRMCCVEETVP